MKTFNFLLLAVAAFLIVPVLWSCKIDSDARPPSLIVGRWKWVSESGGFGGGTRTAVATRDEKIVEFTAKNQYKSYLNNEVSMESPYKLSAAPINGQAETVNLVAYTQYGFQQAYQIIAHDTLVLADYNISDGYTNKYVRLKQ